MIVAGRIITNGTGFSGIIRAYDVDFRSEQLLGSAVLTQQQLYRIEYAADKFSRAEKHRADLVVRALDGRGQIVAETEVLYNAPDVVEGLELVIEARGEPEPPPRLTEYEALLALIEPI